MGLSLEKGSNQFTSAGEDSFLYLNQYGFTFSDNQYKCTTCGIAFDKRKYLIDHIQICHEHAAGMKKLREYKCVVHSRAVGVGIQ